MITKINRFSRRKLQNGGQRQYSTIQHDEVRTDTFLPISATLSRIVRSPRTGNKLADFKNDIEGIARFINGITLQMELTSGDIKVDDVIQELLRMGPVTLDQLLKIPQKDVTAAIDKYKNLPSELKGGDNIAKAEKGAIMREEMRLEIKGFGDVHNTSGVSEYMTTLDTILQMSNGSIIVGKHRKNVAYVLDSLKNVAHYNNKQVVNDPHQEILETTTRLTKVENESAQFQGVLSSLDDLIKTDVVPHFLDPFLDVYNNQQECNKEPLLKNPPNWDAVAANLVVLKNSVSLFKSAEVYFGQLKDVIVSRNSGSNQVFIHVNGFPNGVKDLVKLKTDVRAEWLRNAVNGTEGISDQLLEAFEPIGNFTTGLDVVENAWQSSEASRAVAKIQDMYHEVQWLAAEHNINATLFKASDQCVANKAKISESGILKVHQKMTDLHKKHKGLSSAKQWEEIQGHLESMKEEFKYEGAADATKTQNMVEKLQKSESVKAAIAFFDELSTTLSAFHAFIEDTTLVKEIKGSQGTIESFQTEVRLSTHFEFLNCMKEDIGSGGEEVKRTFEIIQNIRDNGAQNVILAAFELTEALLGSVGEIKKVETVGSAMKGVKNEKMDEVMAAMGKQKLNELTEMFESVKGMDTILKLDEMKPLLGDVKFIVDQAEKSKLPKDDVDRLKEMQTTFTGIYVEIDKVIASVKQDPKNLEDFGPVFDEAARMKSVTLNFEKLIESLEKLDEATNTGKSVKKRAATKLTNVIDALKSLKSLNLDFAGYNFKSAIKVLASLNSFFVDYTPPTNTGGSPGALASPVPSARPGFTAMSQFGYSSTPVASVDSADYTWVYYVGTGVLVVTSIFGIVGCVCCCRKKKGSSGAKQKKSRSGNKPVNGKDNGEGEKKEEEKKEEEKNESNEDEKSAKAEDPKQRGEENPEKKNEKKTPEPKETKPEEPKVPEPIVEVKKVVPTAPTGPTGPVASPLPNDRSEKSTQSISDRSIVGTYQGTDILAEDKSYTMIKAARDSLTVGSNDREHPVSALYFVDNILYKAGQTEVFEGNPIRCIRESRYAYACKLQTMVKITGFEDNFIHANAMVINNITWIMAQAPLGDDPGKDDTREKHWAMIDQHDVGISIQLCQFIEDKQVKCSHYYPENLDEEMIFGRYKVKCVGFVNVDHFTDLKHINVPKFKYTNTETGTEKFVDIMLYDGWPDHKVPKSIDVSIEIIELCESYNKSVLVHCSAGVGRTGTLVGIRKGIELMLKNELMNVEQIVSEVRAHRYQAIQDGSQVIYLILAVNRYSMKKRNIPHSDIFNEMLYYKENFADYEKNYKKCPELVNNENRQCDDTIVPETPEDVARQMDAWRGPEYERLQKDLVKREAFVARKRAEYEAKKKGKKQEEAEMKTSKDKSKRSQKTKSTKDKSKRSQKTKSTKDTTKRSQKTKSTKDKSKKSKKETK